MTTPVTDPVIVTRIQNRRGTQSEFDSLYPPGYTGVGGATGPGVLLPGELALCTDSRRVFLGNLNGEYIELTGQTGGGGGGGTFDMTPLVLSLPPVSTFTELPALSYSGTPFFNIIYDITDNPAADWDSVGLGYSKNGDMKITIIG